MDDFQIRREFWGEICQRSLDNAPRILREGTYPKLGVKLSDCFRAILTESDVFRAEREVRHLLASKFRVYVEGYRELDPLPFLPRREDGSFEGWHARMEDELRGRDYLLIFNQLEGSLGSARESLDAFLAESPAIIGVPCRGAEVSLFAGRYAVTPFGVHDDPNLNMYFPLFGAKRMRLWPPEYPDAHPDLARSRAYAAHLGGSTLLEAQPGDLMTWGGRWWHVAEGNGAFSVSISVDLCWFPEKGPEERIDERLAESLFLSAARETASTLVRTGTEGRKPEEIPQVIARAVDNFRKISPGALQDTLVEGWLRKLTSFGLLPQKLVAAPELRDEDAVRVAPHQTLRWAILSDGKRICVSAAGNSMVLPRLEWIEEMIPVLNRRGTVRVSDLARQVSSSGSGNAPALRKILAALVSFGGLIVVSE